jgi:hypothetical protein
MHFDVALRAAWMSLGAFQVQLRGDPLARITLSGRGSHSRISIRLLRGTASAEDFSQFVRRTRLRVTRIARAGQALFGSLADPFIDLWASSTSRLVRKVDFDVYADGSAKAIYHFVGTPVPVPVSLSRSDVERLVSALFDSESCAGIMGQYQRNLLSARVAASDEARI